jgi:phosphatidylinositol-3-phosphatase
MRAPTTLLRGLAVLLALGGVGALAPAQASRVATSTAALPSLAARPSYVPPVGHVFVINFENKGYQETWGDDSQAPYLSRTLRAKGVLLNRFYATAHNSLPNYLAQISGQAPNVTTQTDCQSFAAFTSIGPDQDGQAVGTGCVYPETVPTLPRQLTDNGLTWRGYMQQMRGRCQHPEIDALDPTQHARKGHNYAVRHNPFMYFASITGRPAYCRSHVRPLSALRHDLLTKSHTRTLSYITPDLCHDAHDSSCADGGPGGLGAANSWFKTWVPRILRSPAFRANGMLVITSDESEGFSVDARACCGEGPGPNAAQPGIDGPGGGRVGALIISRYVQPGTTSSRAYNHYSLLGSIEDLLGLHRLGYARTVTHVFGRDVYRTP